MLIGREREKLILTGALNEEYSQLLQYMVEDVWVRLS